MANEPCLMATFQAWVNVVAAAVWPFAAMPPERKKALRTVGFVPPM